MRWLLIIFIMLAGGCGASPSPGDQTLISQANGLHRTLAPAMVNDPPLRAYLGQISGRMVAAAREVARERWPNSAPEEWMFSKDMQFHIAQSGVPNAFTTGGNHVYVMSAALERLASEDELAAAFAHAYAHTVLRHIQHNIHALPADAPASAVVVRFVERRFNAKQEEEADDLAFMIHARAGWDPGAFAAMLQHLDGPGARIAIAQSKVEQLPRVAQEWSRPPIADVRRFGQHREAAASGVRGQVVPQAVERLLAAMPNCFAAEDLPGQKEAQRELIAPVSAETPNTFEKGQRR